ncbi:MAG: DUF4965 domain-containing protein [Armatimonadetes bacterium]|nr:DUF4965 domain-containing protein [Armatimonadota bacterium]
MLMLQDFRPPAVPLVTHDPFFSVWSFNDRLTDDWTKHWTGKNQAMCGMARIDGKAFRWMSRGLGGLPAMDQVSLEVLPHVTAYTFSAAGIRLTVRFLPWQDVRDPDLCSRDQTDVEVTVLSDDGKPHDVAVYLDCSGELVVDDPSQSVQWSRLRKGGSDVAAMWHDGRKPLNRTGDDHRSDWGVLHLIPNGGQIGFGGSEDVRRQFASSGSLPVDDDFRTPRAVSDDWPVMACVQSVSGVGAEPTTFRMQLAYDDDFAIEYFRRPLRAAWRTGDRPFLAELGETARPASSYESYGRSLMESWTKVGGRPYADLAVLSYRQSLAAHKIVRDEDGSLLMFSKENFSNGCIGTVDVMYPACPIFLAYNPELLKANLKPVLDYAASPRWKWSFAPHDLGQYPKANGQVYGGGEKTEENQMPVEESGNMLIMCAAYLEKTGDEAFIKSYWKELTEWAEYLKRFGVDPGNQLCTDDFAGHMAHNANLSVKAIVAMACYGRMAGHLGDKATMKRWDDTAKGFVKEWMKLADDQGHYRLAFDRAGSWSQKYNLVWDKVLNLGLFPQEVYDKEVAWYLKNQNTFGLPLDNRADYTKLDWTVWTACLASKKSDFDAIMAPLYKWMNETPDRIPLTDWFDTKTGKCVGFRARSVVGGVFMPLLIPELPG